MRMLFRLHREVQKAVKQLGAPEHFAEKLMALDSNGDKRLNIVEFRKLVTALL